MWPFRSQRLTERLELLETAVRKLQSDRKVLEDEWEQVYEKYRTAMSKLARRDLREEGKTAPEPTNGKPPIPEQVLSDRDLLRRVWGR